jgi:hypothetical protein
MAANIFYDDDADMGVARGRTVAVGGQTVASPKRLSSLDRWNETRMLKGRGLVEMVAYHRHALGVQQPAGHAHPKAAPRPDVLVQNRFKTTVVVGKEAWK